MLNNLWFYRLGLKKEQKNIGFIDPATEIVEKPLVLQAKRPKDIEKPLVL